MGSAIKGGTTNVSTVIRIVDSTTGLPETAVEHNTAGIDLWYRRDVDPGSTPLAKVSITEAALASLTTAHADGGIEHIGDGYYRLDLPDAAVAGGAIGVLIGGTVTGMMVIGNYHQLVDYDPNDTVRLGLTSLPNAAADAAGGLPISDAGGLDLDAMNTNINDIETDTNELQADWTNGGRLDLIIDELTTNIDAIETDTQDLQTQIGTAGAGLTNLGGSGNDWNTTTPPTAAAIADAVCDEALSGHTTAGTVGKAISDIEADTNELQGNQGDWATATGFSTHSAADVRTEIDSNSTKLATISGGIIEGTAQTGTLSTTQCSSDLTGYTDDQLIGRIITFTSGPADGESSDITDYAETNGVLTFTALTLAPQNGNTFKIT